MKKTTIKKEENGTYCPHCHLFIEPKYLEDEGVLCPYCAQEL